jgi:uncharacterized metal-binding protein
MSCGCSSGKNRLVYTCSGAANVGYLADQVARRLSLQGQGQMTCLAGVAAHLDGFLRAAATAEMNLVLDGCPVACGRKTFHRLSLPCTSLLLTDFGVEKGSTAITEALITDMTARVAKHLEPTVALTQA